MNGLDMLNAPSGAAAVPAVAARAGDAAPDDPGGDPSRSFNALLAAFDEPAAAAGPAQPAVPVPAPLPAALGQTLRITLEAAAGNAKTAVDASLKADDGTPATKKTSASDDLALTDLAGDAQTPAAPPPADAAPSLQAVTSWSAAVSGAAGLVGPALTGVVPAPAPVSPRQPDATARGDQRLPADGAMTDGLSADVGRLLDAAAGATEAVLSNGTTAQSDDLVLNANVTVLRTETHLPPVTPTTPLHQVVAAITTDGLGTPAEPRAASAPDPAAAPGPERQLVRTLDIRLEPPDLGSVTVKLRLTGEHLTLRISADSAATAQSLEQDRDTLASMLRSNGYSPEISAVRHEPAAAAIPTASSADPAASSQSGANHAGGQSSTDGGARSQNGQPGSHQQQPQPGFAGLEPTDGHDADVQDTAARGGLYL
jgi:chemotaxis protein MotD